MGLGMRYSCQWPLSLPPALPSSGPASALKAAATSLYNLRLKQLQLFLQSLPEEERPRSIPELKALLQSSGGQLSALVSSGGRGECMASDLSS